MCLIRGHRGTSLIRNSPRLGPYIRTWRFLMSEVTMYRVVADVLARVGNYLTTRIASGEDRSHRCRLKSLGAVMWLIRGYPRSPHGEVRPCHRKSTCLTQSTLGPYVVQMWSRNLPYLVVADVLAGVGNNLTTRIASGENTSHLCRLRSRGAVMWPIREYLVYLAQWVFQSVLESQLPHKIVN
jgi:hypothetical protein